MRFKLLLGMCLLLAGLTRPAAADTIAMVSSEPQEIAFPLGDHYRIGRYLPIRLSWLNPASPSYRMDAQGVIPTEVRLASGQNNLIVPLVAVETIERPGWPSRPLFDDERLIGTTTPDIDIASELFPGMRVSVVTLDLVNPLPGPAMAWGALDAALLDASAAARVTERQVKTLLAGGTAVAIRSDARPGGPWRWQKLGVWWVMRSDAPAVGLVQPERYTSASPTTPASFRRTIAFTLLAFALAALAASLWRSRWAWAVVVLLAVVTSTGLAAWRSQQPTSVASSSEERSGMWLDRWTCHGAFADGEVRHPVDASDAAAWPVFFSRRHAQDAELHLQCAADGTPQAFVARLKRGQSVMFLNRSVEPLTSSRAAAALPAARTR